MKRRLTALLLALLLTLALLPAAAAAETYGPQGYDNTVTMLAPSDITVRDVPGDCYYNVINTAFAADKDVAFVFTLGAGMNKFSEESFIANNMPKLFVQTPAGEDVATYANGLLRYMGFDSARKELTISVPAGTLAAGGSYKLLFRSDVCGNNTSKILGVNIYFEFRLEAGAIADDWQKIGGRWYYGRDGAYLTGLQELEGYQRTGAKWGVNTYFFDETGAMQTGFFKGSAIGVQSAAWYFFSESGSTPVKSTKGQMIRNYYVDSPSQGYISPSEQIAIESGKTRVYRYYFNPNGTLFTGWYKDDLSFDKTGKWRYFSEIGSTPIKSRLGRMCRYGLTDARYCLGNGGEHHAYFFSATGGMFTGTNGAGTFCAEGTDPATDLLGALLDKNA